MMVLTFVGLDSWSRPVYKNEGRFYVDVAPLSWSAPEICTKYGNAFDGEPDAPVNHEFQFVPERKVWR